MLVERDRRRADQMHCRAALVAGDAVGRLHWLEIVG
jgi:hypothetical protein